MGRFARHLGALDAQTPRAGKHGAAVDGNAIHAHPIERRLVALRVDVLAKDGSRALGEGQGFDRQRRKVLRDQSFGIGGREHGAQYTPSSGRARVAAGPPGRILSTLCRQSPCYGFAAAAAALALAFAASRAASAWSLQAFCAEPDRASHFSMATL